MNRALVSLTLLALPVVSLAAECPYEIGAAVEAQELRHKIAMHKTWVGSHGESGQQGQFCNLDLSDGDVAGQVLTEANFTGATLTSARLDGANLHGADLGTASLKNAILTKANLDGANLADANMEGANLRKASLKKTTLRGAVLKAATLSKADMTVADLSDADLNNARMRKTNLSEAQLVYADLTNASLRAAVMQRAVFDEVELKGADLHGVTLAGNHFIKTDLNVARGASTSAIDEAMAWSAKNPEGEAPSVETADAGPTSDNTEATEQPTDKVAKAGEAIAEDAKPESVTAEPSAKPEPAAKTADAEQVATAPAPEAKQAEAPAKAAAVKAVQVLANAPRPPVKKRKIVRRVDSAIDAGVYVQLGAGRSPRAAKEAVDSLRTKHDAQLDGLPGRVSEFNHQQSGRWYRVLFGPVSDRDEAREVCAQIISDGSECILRLQQS